MGTCTELYSLRQVLRLPGSVEQAGVALSLPLGVGTIRKGLSSHDNTQGVLHTAACKREAATGPRHGAEPLHGRRRSCGAPPPPVTPVDQDRTCTPGHLQPRASAGSHRN